MNYINQIKRLYEDIYPKEKQESDKLVHLWGYYVTRPISMLITPFFIKLNIGANIATYIGFFLGLLSLLSGCSGNPVIAVILYNCFFIFDSLDGNLARYYGPSKQGELLDAMTGNIVNFLFLPSIAIGIELFNLKYLCFYDSLYSHLIPIAFFSTLVHAISMLIAKDMKIIMGKKTVFRKNNENKVMKIFENFFRNSFGMAIAGPFSIIGIIFNIFDLFIFYNLIISFIVLLFCVHSIIKIK